MIVNKQVQGRAIEQYFSDSAVELLWKLAFILKIVLRIVYLLPVVLTRSTTNGTLILDSSSSEEIGTHDPWIRKRTRYPVHHSVPIYSMMMMA